MAQEERHGGTLANRVVCRQTGGSSPLATLNHQTRRNEAALALIIGTEVMAVFRDVLQLDDTNAQKVRRWAIRALVEAAKRPAKETA